MSHIQINEMLTVLLNRLEDHNIFLFSVFQTMYKTGGRFSDIYNHQNWTVIDANYLKLTPQKNNNIRIIPASDINFYLYDSILNGWDIGREFSYSYAKNAYNRFFPGPKLFVKSKPVTTHLFRHNKAKLLKKEGNTDSQIQQYLGEKSITSANQYIYSNIYTA